MRLNFIPNLISILLILSIPNLLFSQKDRPFKWGEVSSEDLAMTVYEKDTSAIAVVLGSYGKMDVEKFRDGYGNRFYKHRQIKILNEAGFRYGDIHFSYYSYRDKEIMTKLKAQVINPDGTKIPLSDKDFFKEEINEYYSAVKISFPKLQIGSIIEYEFETLSEYTSQLPTWYFQEIIPVKHSELRVKFHSNLSYTYLFEGNADMARRVEDGIVIMEGESGKMIAMENKFILTDGAAIKEGEPYITTINDYRARIRFQLDYYFDYQGLKHQFLSSWEEIADELEHHTSFGNLYNRKFYSKKMVKELAPIWETMPTEMERAKLIYNHITENITWNENFSYFANEDLNEVIEKGEGNSGAINLLQLALLRAAGIEANPMLISTRDNGKMYEAYPILEQFDHVLVYAKIDGKEMVIDVPSKNRSIEMPMSESLNQRGAVIYRKKAAWKNVKAPFGNDTFVYTLTLDEEGNLTGDLSCSYRGHYAIPERLDYKKDKSGKHWIERFSEIFSEVEIDSVSYENLDNPEKPFKDNLKLNIPEAAQVVGDFIYFNPILYSNFRENMFKLEKRYFPVDFPYPFGERFFINLKIPEGYAIEELPKSANFALANKGGKFRYVTEKKDDHNLQIVVDLKVRQLYFLPIEYQGIRELFSLVEEKMGEQIVLKKI